MRAIVSFVKGFAATSSFAPRVAIHRPHPSVAHPDGDVVLF
jgi:hypothetical protein